MFDLLFNHPLVAFQQGRLVWNAPVPAWALLLGLGAAVAGLGWSYWRARGRIGRRDRAVLLGLRAGALAVLAFCLLRPTLLVPTAVPQRNTLAVLVDDSRSMRIADREGEVRADWVQRALDAERSPLLRQLGERYRLRLLRFSDVARRMDGAGELGFGGRRSDLARALDGAREQLAAGPLAGVVLLSDGADNALPDLASDPAADAALESSLLALRAASVPVFPVGVGRERWERDIEVSRVGAPASVLQGSSLLVDVVLAQTGYSGESVELVVEDEGRIVDVQPVTLPRDGAPAVVRARLVAEEPGPRLFRFRVQVRPGERVLENNQRDALIEVRDARRKVLYFEGEPRFEVKFLRRAVADDPQLQLVVLQRTAENRYLRLDVDSAAELESGFPQTREELFAYDALILGSVEASFFSDAQLRMIADFVAERGGGLLMLGGRRSFSEGGYAGTPLAEALPVALHPGDRDTTFFAELRVTPTREGRSHAALQVEEDLDRSATRWASLPPLSTLNRIRALKPGATALLTGSGPALPREQVVLAQHRYGRGRAAALAVQDTWIWQMHSAVPLEDMTHERFWRQMLRWLVSEVPGPVEVVSSPRRADPGQSVRLLTRVRDGAYRPAGAAAVTARVEGPDGEAVEVPLRRRVEREGEYTGVFTPREAGSYRVTVASEVPGRPSAVETAWVRVEEGEDEFFAAQLRAPLLRRIAEETGGRYFSAADVHSLPQQIRYRARGVTVTEEREIWNMPIVLLLLVALLCAEWGYRRARGLP